MSTTPLYQPPPPDTTSTQHAYTSSAAHGSVGPVIGVLAAITVLGVIAGMVGRMCSGKPVMGYGGHYDLEGWIETKCASCIDGRVEPPPRPNRPVVAAVPMAGQSQEASVEIKEEGEVEGADEQDTDDEDEEDTDDEDEEDTDDVEEHQEEEKVSHDRN